MQVEKYVEEEGKGEWRNESTQTLERKFYLDDGTGKVLVNPQLAEYELPNSFRAEIGPKSSRTRFLDTSLGVPSPSDQDLLAYLTTGASQAAAALEASNVPGAKIAGQVVKVAQALDSLGISVGGGSVGLDLGGHTYRFTEKCLVADRVSGGSLSDTRTWRSADDNPFTP